MARTKFGFALVLASAVLLAPAVVPQQPALPPSTGLAYPSSSELAQLRKYIARTWDTLTRSLKDLPTAARDEKVPTPAGGAWPVYLPAHEAAGNVERQLRHVLTREQLNTIQLKALPDSRDPRALAAVPPGLLYLPEPYVVPGGRFNEMYGWDSYFTALGLLGDDRIDLARGMSDNFRYEIENYGTLLNANRTYYLTRSQPPFYTRMLLDIYGRTHDRAWLRRAVPAVDTYYEYWTREPHLVPQTGLSRYYDLGDGPAPEVVHGERDAHGLTHYDRVRAYYRTHTVTDYDESRYYDARQDALTPLFYKADRAMRESGFDPSNRFGPFGAGIIDYVPVCLNALLYRMEQDAGQIAEILGDAARASEWRRRADARGRQINALLWDGDAGLYFDYNFTTGRRRVYPFATTFYPLWAGLASRTQAAQVRDNLSRFEAAGGLLTSTNVTGSQWDAPFGWAPLQIIAVEGLRRYGYQDDADRLSRKFVALVARDFAEHGVIVEKYDLVRARSDIAKDVKFGYTTNVIGFGWTNAAIVTLMHGLKSDAEK